MEGKIFASENPIKSKLPPNQKNANVFIVARCNGGLIDVEAWLSRWIGMRLGGCECLSHTVNFEDLVAVHGLWFFLVNEPENRFAGFGIAQVFSGNFLDKPGVFLQLFLIQLQDSQLFSLALNVLSHHIFLGAQFPLLDEQRRKKLPHNHRQKQHGYNQADTLGKLPKIHTSGILAVPPVPRNAPS